MGREFVLSDLQTDMSASYWTRLDGCSYSSLFLEDMLFSFFGAVLLLQTCATVHMMSVHGLDSPHFLLCSDETRVGVVENLGVG